MNSTLNIHAIILALNEEIFIKAQLDTIYPFCSGISIISQYDRDWYAKNVNPDKTTEIILNYPDPEGKIHFIVRRKPDEAAARNMEMLSFNSKSFRKTITHGNEFSLVKKFHSSPDYFWIIDADEIYDSTTIPAIMNYLSKKKPRGMRVTGYNYLRTWNQRVPKEIIDFTHFGFLKPGVLFEQRRIVSWNESRLSKLFKMMKLKDYAAALYGFIQCPESVGVFHHGCWLGDNFRIKSKFDKSSHKESQEWEPNSVDAFKTVYISFNQLPLNIQQASWPAGFFNEKNG